MTNKKILHSHKTTQCYAVFNILYIFNIIVSIMGFHTTYRIFSNIIRTLFTVSEG